MAKLPSMQFYPGDWRKDPGVQSLNYEDRGIWFEILLLMFESGQRGKLVLNGKKMPDEALAQMLGLDNQKCKDRLTRLIDNGVAKVEEGTGIIYCSRMVKDEELRVIRKKAGEKGGNPALLNQKPTTKDKQNPTPSSSSSSSSSSSLKHIKEEGAVETMENVNLELTKSQIALIFESRWLAYEGEKDNKKIALGYWKAKVKTEQDVKDYDQAVLNYYGIVASDRKNGFPGRRLKGGKTWFNNYESYINQKPPAQVAKDGIQKQNDLDEEGLKAYCVKQLEFVETDLAEGEDRNFDWFHAALDKRVMEYEQRFGHSPFTAERHLIYLTLKEEMMGKIEE